MLNVLSVLSFLFYHVVLMRYAAAILGVKKHVATITAVSAVVNALLFMLTLNLSANSIYIMLIGYTVIYFVLFKIMSQVDIYVTLFGVFAFAINIFARRVIVTSVFAIVFDISMAEVYTEPTYRALQSIVPFVWAGGYLLMLKNFVKPKHFNMFFDDKPNVRFATRLLGITFVFFVYVVTLIGAQGVGDEYAYLFMMLGLASSFSYPLALAYAFLFNRLRGKLAKYEQLRDSMKEEELAVAKLTQQSTVDAFTGCSIRDVALEKTKHLLLANVRFQIVFVDMDGLKIVNDTYGHAEGDFYIKSVADELHNYFADEVVSRLGGDEFLIVTQEQDVETVNNRISAVYYKIKQLGEVYLKPYKTSISYGVKDVLPNTPLSAAELIKAADNEMYENKKRKKLQRTV